MLTIPELIRLFSTRESLPVQVDDVIDEFRKHGIKDEIYIWQVEADTDLLRGKIKHWDWEHDGNKTCVADIDISKNMDVRWQRIVSCKELLHMLDPPEAQVKSEDEIDHLVEKIILPAGLQDPVSDGYHVNTDRVAELQASAVLFPFAARNLFLKPFQEKKLPLAEIIRLTDLPPRYVAYVMSDIWPGIHELLAK